MNKTKTLTLSGKKYPYRCSNSVLAEIQEEMPAEIPAEIPDPESMPEEEAAPVIETETEPGPGSVPEGEME